MRPFISLGLAASILAFAAPAMAQAPDLRFGNGGGHAVGGGGYAYGGAANQGAAPQGNGFGRGGGTANVLRPGPGGRVGFQGGNRGGLRQYGGDYRRHGGYGGAAVGAGIAGLAAGAVIGGAIANQQTGYNQGYGYDQGYGYGYGYQPAPVPAYEGDEDVQAAPASGDEVSYCEGRYRSYDPASGTYLGFDGLRHPCP